MAVHFDFILDDNEAESLMYAMQRIIANDNSLILDMMASEHPDDYKEASIKCIREHIEYTKSIMEKMHNTYVAPYWNTLGNIETHFGEWVKVVDMNLHRDMICYKYEPLDSTYSKPALYGYRKLSPEDLKEFKEWLGDNNEQNTC
jgi:hypothetical protein